MHRKVAKYQGVLSNSTSQLLFKEATLKDHPYVQKNGIHKNHPSIHNNQIRSPSKRPQNHQTFQVPKMQVLKAYKAILQVGFPLPLYMNLTYPIGSMYDIFTYIYQKK